MSFIMCKYNLINTIYIYIYIYVYIYIYIYIYQGVEMADKPISTSLQPSNSGNLMYFIFLNKCLLSYIMKLLVL